MNKYETVFLLNIELSIGKQKEIIDKITKCITDYGKIINIQNVGKRTLAYEIRKQKLLEYRRKLQTDN